MSVGRLLGLAGLLALALGALAWVLRGDGAAGVGAERAGDAQRARSGLIDAARPDRGTSTDIADGKGAASAASANGSRAERADGQDERTAITRVVVGSADSALRGGPESEAPVLRSLQGRVRGADGAPLRGIEARMAFAGHEQRAKTDAEGRFELQWPSGLPAPLALVGPREIDLHLIDWGAESDEREFELGASAVLGGRLLPAPAEPGGRALLLRRSDRPSRVWEHFEAPLDELGRFLFEDLDPGEFQLAALAPDRAAAPVGGVVLREGERREVTLASVALTALEGRAVDVGGTGTAGVELALRPRGRHWPREVGRLFEVGAVSDADGSFELGHAFPGRARLSYSAPTGASGRREVVPGAGAEIELRIAEPAALTGAVLLPDGSPAAGAAVVLAPLSARGALRDVWGASSGQSVDDARVLRARTDEHGEFAIPGAPSGATLVVLARAATAGPGGQRITGLGAGALRELDGPMLLPERGRLSGRASIAGGGTLSGEVRALAVIGRAEVECARAALDGDGEFVLEGLPQGALNLRFEAVGCLPRRERLDGLPEAPVVVELERARRLAGWISLPGGVAPRHAAVRLFADEGGVPDPAADVVEDSEPSPLRVEGTDAFGHFELEDLAPGRYLLDVLGEDLQLARRVPLAVELRDADRVDLVLEVESAGRPEPASFTGEVWSSAAEPLDGLRLIGAGPGALVAADGGVFEVSGVEPGPRRLRIVAEGHSMRELGQLDVQPGERRDLGLIELFAGRRFEVRVVTRGAAPRAAELSVRLLPLPAAEGGAPGAVRVALEPVAPAQAGADLLFRTDQAPPGRWRLRVDGAGWSSATRLVSVPSHGARAPLQVALSPKR